MYVMGSWYRVVMSPAILQSVVTTKWTDAYSRASCAHCSWTTDAQGHVATHLGHIVAVDRGQTRYVQGAS